MSTSPSGTLATMPAVGDETVPAPRFWLPAGTLWVRELRGFYRQRSRVLGTLSTPLLMWFALGSGFGSSTMASGGDYAQFFFPGTVALAVMFAAIFSNISVIEDRREGFMLGVLVAPVSRLSLVLGKVLGATTIGAIQGALLLPLAPLAGLRPDPASLPAVFGILFLTACGLTALGFACAWWLDSVQGFHSIMNLVLMPMWLMSGSVFPMDGSSAWVRWLTAANPLSYGVAELRRLLGGTVPEAAPAAATCWLVLGCFVALAVSAAWLRVSRSETSALG